ncbi:hypothetical protein XH88_33095 [Bradyrhizobium sp. CCBAU 51627]|nr:hypothetical protein [Bradyrhizobium sp. CCBAU 51627]
MHALALGAAAGLQRFADLQRMRHGRVQRLAVESVAASVMKPAPVTPEAPFDVIMAMPRMPGSCQMVRCVLVACARNSVASVM